MRGSQISARLLQLVIDFRRLDDSEQLSLLDVRTDVNVPGLEIAIGPRVDGRNDIRLNVRR